MRGARFGILFLLAILFLGVTGGALAGEGPPPASDALATATPGQDPGVEAQAEATENLLSGGLELASSVEPGRRGQGAIRLVLFPDRPEALQAIDRLLSDPDPEVRILTAALVRTVLARPDAERSLVNLRAQLVKRGSTSDLESRIQLLARQALEGMGEAQKAASAEEARKILQGMLARKAAEPRERP